MITSDATAIGVINRKDSQLTQTDPPHHRRIEGTIFGPTAVRIYDDIIARCRHRIAELTTIQFDPETGIQRHYFNGKLEKTVHVRDLKKD